MINAKILYIEDSAEDITTFNNTVNRYNTQNDGIHNISCQTCLTLTEAEVILADRNNHFDTIIIDIKLNNISGSGNNIVETVKKHFLRIPCIAYTATPDDVNEDFIIKKFIKATNSIDDVLDYTIKLKETGIPDILGSNGKIEEQLSNIYNNNIKPHIEYWIENNRVDADIEQSSLLRYITYCITESINQEYEKSLVKEIYIIPPINSNYKTGSIIQNKTNCEIFIILSPECDMVLRENGLPKTDQILIVKIEEFKDIIKPELNGITSTEKKQKAIVKYLSNNHCGYYHYLPQCKLFDNKLINFRKITSINYDRLKEEYSIIATVTTAYVKDILCRFSNYYARQGQPDFHFKELASTILEEIDT